MHHIWQPTGPIMICRVQNCGHLRLQFRVQTKKKRLQFRGPRTPCYKVINGVTLSKVLHRYNLITLYIYEFF